MLAEQERLDAVVSAARVVADRGGSLAGLTRLATDLLGVDFGFLSLVGSDHEVLTAVARPDTGAMPERLSIEASVCRHLVAAGSTLVVPDLSLDPRMRDLDEVRALGLRSYAGTPVTTEQGLVLGGFCVGHREPRDWSEPDLSLLRGLAEAVSVELRLLVALAELDRGREAERLRAEQQSALHRVASAVARGEAPDVVLQQVAEELARLLDVTTALVVRFRGRDGVDVVACAGDRDEHEVPCPETVEVVRRTGRSAARAGCTACAAVPVLINDRTWGAVVTVGAHAGEDQVLDQLEQLADFISLVVVNTEAQGLLVELARTDPLTGAANRRVFDERLAEELERARRHGSPLALALLDVDHFKRVNDEHGHEAGDRVLQELARRVGAQLRTSDLLARLGGDEWALLLPQADAEEAAAVVERIRAQVAAAPLGGVGVTITVGVAVAQGTPPTAQELYRRADGALYAAKADGRNAVRLAPAG